MYLNKMNLNGKNAVVTGGGRGIGLSCVDALSEAGANVIIIDFDEQSAESGRQIMLSKGVEVQVEILDITNSMQVTSTAQKLNKLFGHIDILINNAGIARSETPAEIVSDEHWLNVIDVNLNGLFWCCRAFGKFMLENKSGSIVNIGSMSGIIVNKPQEQAYYNASKAAVHHLTKSLGAEWARRGVRVNAVAPTYINTPLTAFAKSNEKMFNTWLEMTPMGRLGEPDEIASVVLFLASDASSLLTGSIIVADGGYTCW
ncbi:MAG: SDR family oxidoreductase [Chitinophagia bacterium]|nr:SDR family oxidoreductase [Chitinophagia bacterium]